MYVLDICFFLGLLLFDSRKRSGVGGFRRSAKKEQKAIPAPFGHSKPLEFKALRFCDVRFLDAGDYFNAAVNAYDHKVVLVLPNNFEVGIAAIVPDNLFICFLAVFFVNHIANVGSIQLKIFRREINKVF
jgi:hypothetical protein